jgi:hypothetical protein
VVLTRKHADVIDGIDLVGHEVGDRLPLNRHDADLLVAEGWAQRVPEGRRRQTSDQESVRTDRPRRDRLV